MVSLQLVQVMVSTILVMEYMYMEGFNQPQKIPQQNYEYLYYVKSMPMKGTLTS